METGLSIQATIKQVECPEENLSNTLVSHSLIFN